MNKQQYKLLSSRVRAAYTACVEAHCVSEFSTNHVAATVARRLGVKPVNFNRCAITSGSHSCDPLGDFGAGLILRRFQEKCARAAQRGISVMLDAVNHLNGWRVVDVTPADPSEHIEITPIEVCS